MSKPSWYHRNKVRHNESSEAYCESHKEQIQAYQKEYREKNREKLAAQKREYYLANKERLNASMAEYAEANAEKIAEYQRQYRESNKEKLKANAKERIIKRTEYVRKKDAARRRELSKDAKTRIFAALGDKCYCCGLDDPRFLTIDHINNDGMAERKPNGKQRNAYVILLDILKAGVPKDRYQLACYNCNCARHYTKDKICPHRIPLND